NDRIVLRYHMGLLSRTEVRDYIAHRLMIAGSHGDIKFTAPALRLVYAYSKGLPRRINAAAERCLLIAFLKGSHTVDRGIAREALKELKGEQPSRPAYRRYALIAAALCLAIVAGLALMRLDFSAMVGEREGLAKIAEHPQARREFIIRRDDWTVRDYAAAQGLLLSLPGQKDTDAVLNLHPAPEFLKDIGRPMIAAINGGYCVVHHADANSVWLTGRDRAIFEVPLARFAGFYRWNIAVRYRKGQPEQIYRMADTGERVRWIQSVLHRGGYMKVKPNGVFGVETAAGIEKLQESFGLKRDGVVGAETLALIDVIGGRP
ncbi:MAG TPA: peptidoglycan-binding protein, partial [Deltaproteobacteria bacterium]|nr:peptidoglycan-binding protein [Deltaproteobacteria bacterium]